MLESLVKQAIFYVTFFHIFLKRVNKSLKKNFINIGEGIVVFF